MSGETRSPADRLRDGMILGVTLVFTLGLLAALWPAALWALVGITIASRIRRLRPESSRATATSLGSRIGFALPSIAAVAVAWPPLVRPILQGDSLANHLPNAASWVQAHSLWTTTTNYWFYPGGSEMFAAGLLAAAGPLAVGFAGFAALLLLGLRLQEWGVATGLRPWIAGAISAFTLSSFVFSEEAGSLENDVWLAAFFLEMLWLMRSERAGAFVRTTALTTLVKPFGWFYAAFLTVLRGPGWGNALLAFVPLALWVGRDALLWRDAIIPPASVYYADWLETTLIGHGWTGMITLWKALQADGAATVILFLAGILSIAIAPDLRLRIAALISLVILLAHPFGFSGAKSHEAEVYSLRYISPLLVLGSLFIARDLGGAAAVVGAGALAVATLGIARIIGIFQNDALTHGWPFVVALLALLFLLPWNRIGRWALVLSSCALIAYAIVLAGSHPLDYYEDWLGRDQGHSRFFHWLAASKPAAIVGYGLRIGAVAAVTPTTRAIDTAVRNPCREAHTLGALLVVAGDVLVTVRTDYATRRAFAERCGSIVFDDGWTVVVRPY